MNQKYLDKLRINSSYPTFRGFVNSLATAGYVLAGLIVLVAVFAGLAGGSVTSFGIGAVMTVLGVIIGLFFRAAKEASLMLADIADATLDSAGKKDL